MKRSRSRRAAKAVFLDPDLYRQGAGRLSRAALARPVMASADDVLFMHSGGLPSLFRRRGGGVMTMWPHALFAPRRVALVGASATQGKARPSVPAEPASRRKRAFRAMSLRFIREQARSCGRPAYPSLAAVPGRRRSRHHRDASRRGAGRHGGLRRRPRAGRRRDQRRLRRDGPTRRRPGRAACWRSARHGVRLIGPELLWRHQHQRRTQQLACHRHAGTRRHRSVHAERSLWHGGFSRSQEEQHWLLQIGRLRQQG